MQKDREETLQKAYDQGFHYEKEYKGCSQCVLAAIQDTLGMENDAGFNAVFKSATGLAGGLSGTCSGSCGALTGGVMAISYKVGRERNNFSDPEEIRFKTRDLTLRLYDKFIETYGSGNCQEIQKKLFGRSYNLLDPADREAFEQAGSHIDKCPAVVAKAARWAVDLLLDV